MLIFYEKEANMEKAQRRIPLDLFRYLPPTAFINNVKWDLNGHDKMARFMGLEKGFSNLFENL